MDYIYISLSLRRLMHMVHVSGNTSVVLKSSSDWLNYTGFPGDVCVVFFNVLPGNKDAVKPNPLTKEESHRVYKSDNERLSGQQNAGFSEVCEIFKVIESLKYIRVSHTVLYFHAPKHDAEWNELWLVIWHGRALTNECNHIFQTFSRQSEGLATRDYIYINLLKSQFWWNGLSMEGQKSLGFHLKKNICVSRMTESLMGLEWCEGE